MRFVLFYQSLVSDWNHATAHFLRGLATELTKLGHSVRIFEPADGWSLRNLREQCGEGAIRAFHAMYPGLRSTFYDPIAIDLDETLADADVVIAHEWNDADFLRRLGEHRARHKDYKLLFHDAPHRPLLNPFDVREHAISRYDGVLASGEALREMYIDRNWADHVWAWRDAVDTSVFQPVAAEAFLDLVWIGTWGPGQRTTELHELLLEPIRTLGLRARCYGPRFPPDAQRTLQSSGIDYAGWILDFGVPAALAAARMTLHLPRRLQADGLPRTPAIRAMQALACGVPLITGPWDECNQLFRPDSDLLVATDGKQMQRHITALLADPEHARSIAAHGHRTVIRHHTCAHRARELLAICEKLGADNARDEVAGRLRPSSEALERREPHPVRSRTPAAWN
ncbi:MAG TPA: glycosyltransferase [Steroidobacteraceae bacterium]|nr:glycosyltransferase [Steroidobacteraceae bacterium]